MGRGEGGHELSMRGGKGEETSGDRGRAGIVRGDKGEDFGRERRVGRKGSPGRGSSHGRVCCRGGRDKSLSSVNQPSDACYGRTPVQAKPASDSTPSAPRFVRGNYLLICDTDLHMHG